MGLDPSSLGMDAIHQAVRRRQEQSRHRDAGAYLQFVRESPQELQLLIEAIVVSETWFFRHEDAFSTLVAWMKTSKTSRPADSGDPYRILSIPCSTGEEPYSIAMALLDSGMSADRFRIDAVDISRQALMEAGRALYRENAFRSRDLSFRERHFVREEAGYRLSTRIRDCVQFRWGNLHAPEFMSGSAPYDVIFCRNVLIYFDAEKQRHAIGVLRRLLRPSGAMFVGPAEGFLMIDSGFAPMLQRMSFGFQVAQPRPAPAPAQPRLPRPKPVFAGVTAKKRTPPPAVAKPPQQVKKIETKIEAPLSLETARMHADAGRLDEARGACETLLRSAAASAEVYTLLGVVCGAAGDARAAEDNYKRALYLDPGHRQALVHLAVVMERNGDAGAARRLRDRARKTEEREAGAERQ